MARAHACPPDRKVIRRRNFFTRFPRKSDGVEHLVFARVGSSRSDSGQGWTLTGSVVYEQTSDWPDVLMLFYKYKLVQYFSFSEMGGENWVQSCRLGFVAKAIVNL